jgi:hypothetical protein
MSRPRYDYNSKEGMATAAWGGQMWFCLHVVAQNYPPKPSDEDRVHYHNYFVDLQHVLPCGGCRENYAQNLKDTGFGPEVFDSRHTLTRFIWALHNTVNERLQKPTRDFESTRDFYEQFRARCRKRTARRESGCVDPSRLRKFRCKMLVLPADGSDADDSDDEAVWIDPRCYEAKRGRKKRR